MKKGLLLLISWLLLIPAISFAQTDLTEYDALVADRKYETAWNWLEEQDPDNTNPEMFVLKTDHILSYFCVSMNHQMFGIKNLEPGEDLMEIRSNLNGNYNIVMFNAEDIGDSLLLIHPDNALVYRAKGNYYYDMYLRYGEGLGYDEEGLLLHAYESFEKAAELGDEFAHGHYVMGYLQLLQDNHAEAKAQFIQSIELDPEYPTAHYNLAYIYLIGEEWQDAYNEAMISAELYEDTEFKADAYRLAGVAAKGMEKYDLARKQLETSLNIMPDHGTYNNLIDMGFITKDKKIVKRYSLEKLALDYSDQQSYEELYDIYTENNAVPDLIKLLHEIVKSEKDNLPAEINANLTMAYIYENQEKLTEARGYYVKTHEAALKLLGEDHEFVVALKGVIEELEGKK